MLVFVPYVGMLTGLVLATLVALMQFRRDRGPRVGMARVRRRPGAGRHRWSPRRWSGKRIGLHPVAVIFALLAFGQIFGFFGVLLALPASAALLVGLRHLRSRYLRELVLQELMQQLLLEICAAAAADAGQLRPRAQRRGAAGAARPHSPAAKRFVYLWGAAGSGRTHLLRGFAPRGRSARRVLRGGRRRLDARRGRRARSQSTTCRASTNPVRSSCSTCTTACALRAARWPPAATLPPARLALRDDLRSRLASGLVLQVHPLSTRKRRGAARARRGARAWRWTSTSSPTCSATSSATWAP